MNVLSNFQTNSRRVMKRRKLSYGDMSLVIGKPKPFIWRTMNKTDENPTLSTLQDIADALGVDLHTLLRKPR